MSFTLASVPTTPPPGKPADSSSAQLHAQEAEAPDSFGKALSRAMTPAGEASGKPGAKAAAPAAAKRQPVDDRTEPPELLNAAALALVPPTQGPVLPAPDRVSPAALARTGLAAAANTSAARAAGAPLTEPSTAAASELSTHAAESTAAEPGSRAPSAPTSALMAASHEGKALPPARLNAVEADTAPALLRGGVPAPTPNAATSDASSQDENPTHQTPQAPVIALSAASAAPATAAAAPADEAATLPLSAKQTASADNASPNALVLGAVTAMAPGATGVASADAAPAAPASPQLAPEVGSAEWGKALGQQVVHLSQAGQQQAELQLNPPGLGPLKVTLSLNDHQIQAMFVSSHASVRAAVEAALPQLRASLADNGISLGNTSVSADNQQQAAFAQEQHRQPNQRTYPSSPMASTAASLSPRPRGEMLRQQHGITVDTYA